jgi:hypothetical protein
MRSAQLRNVTPASEPDGTVILAWSPDSHQGQLRRFAARVPGLASGLALAVRPAGSVEAPGQRRAEGSSVRSTDAEHR